MTDDLQDSRDSKVAIVLFIVILLLIGGDLLVDYREGASSGHLSLELLVLLTAASGIVLLWRQLNRTRVELDDALTDAEQWRSESRALVHGLGVAIKKQFTEWQLSNAETEIGFLLLKGLSHKEIAQIRQTSERTIRGQARALYRKSRLSGRASLSAFFLEDLLPPLDDEHQV